MVTPIYYILVSKFWCLTCKTIIWVARWSESDCCYHERFIPNTVQSQAIVQYDQIWLRQGTASWLICSSASQWPWAHPLASLDELPDVDKVAQIAIGYATSLDNILLLRIYLSSQSRTLTETVAMWVSLGCHRSQVNFAPINKIDQRRPNRAALLQARPPQLSLSMSTYLHEASHIHVTEWSRLPTVLLTQASSSGLRASLVSDRPGTCLWLMSISGFCLCSTSFTPNSETYSNAIILSEWVKSPIPVNLSHNEILSAHRLSCSERNFQGWRCSSADEPPARVAWPHAIETPWKWTISSGRCLDERRILQFIRDPLGRWPFIVRFVRWHHHNLAHLISSHIPLRTIEWSYVDETLKNIFQ